MSLLDLQFRQKPHDFEAAGSEFKPLALPDSVRVAVGALEPDDLDEADVDFSVELDPGRYDVPISHGTPVHLEVRHGCRLVGRACASRVSGGAAEVGELWGRFATPLVLQNILATLDELRTLFRDRRLARVLETAQVSALAGRWLGRVLRRFGLKGRLAVPALLLHVLQDRLDAVTAIELSAFRAVPARRGSRRELRFQFDGHVVLAGRVRIPFRKVRLPTFILPALQARVADLLGSNPLASGEPVEGRLPVEALARAILGSLSRFEASARVVGAVPPVRARTQTFNRSSLEAFVRVPGQARVHARVQGTAAHGRITVEGEGLEVAIGERRLALDLKVGAGLDELIDVARQVGRRGEALELDLAPAGEPAPEAGRIRLTLREGSQLGPIAAQLRVEHPLAGGATALGGTLDELRLAGTCELAIDAARRTLAPAGLALAFAGRLATRPDSTLDVGASQLSSIDVTGEVEGAAAWAPGAPLQLKLASSAELKLQLEQRLQPIPEVSVTEGRLRAGVEAKAALVGGVTLGGPEGRPGLDFEGAKLEATLGACDVALDGLRLSVPRGSAFDVEVRRGFLNANGLGELELGVAWDLQGESPVLEGRGRRAVLFVEALRKMRVHVGISPSGRLSFAGGHRGLYDGDFLNAVVDPVGFPKKWEQILSDDEAMAHVLDAVGVLSGDLEKLARNGQDLFKRARKAVDEEGVKEPADFIPRDRMARVLSRVLAGDDRLQERLAAIVKGVTDAEGLDRRAVEEIFDELYPDHGFAFELDRVLRWLDHMLAPAEPLPPPAITEETPLVERARHAALLAGVPSADALYRSVSAPGPLDPEAADRVVRLAPWLAREQLAWIVQAGGDRFGPAQRARLGYVSEVKRRVDLVAKGYGGIGYAPQAMAIAFFLADVLDANDRYFAPLSGAPSAGPVPVDGILGPEDVAVLLQAGLANVTPSRTVQINQRMLVDYLLRRPPLFFVSVLTEMGLRSPRVLANVLSNLLNQDQRQMREPLDMPGTLGKLLGLEMPRRSEYMAGGRWAKESYYGALMRTAEFVLDQAEPYLACKLHLQAERVPPAERRAGPGLAKMEAEAKKAVARADKAGQRCRFDGGEAAGPLDEAREAYEEAFAACREVLAVDRRAFQRDWLKRFWFRNHEALVVRSVVRNYQDDVDRVRAWLHTRAGRDDVAATEQRLLESVVDVLYYFAEDRGQLLGDPLVRLLLDPPRGRYDFTVVSGMGVITEGAKGRELEDAFQRLEAQHGVRLVRANTGTAKPLEHNAAKVVEAIEQVQTPYGLIGYSQGCANVLMAEAALLAGTPSRRALLEGLRCRNFLFSAVNGSAHGSCGNEKLRRAMVEGELFLKHYQAIFSSFVIENFNHVLDAALNLPFLSVVLGSVDSLSHEGVVGLARDGQFLDHVPSSTVRGAVIEEIVPEALEMLSHVITRQVRGALHDTQVTLVSAVAHPNRVKTPAAEVLERCDMGSYGQISHHWSPLLHETAFITTERDRRRAIYDFPKDRHVFPWIEVNARFGNIAVKQAAKTRAKAAPKAEKKPTAKAARKRTAG